MKLKENGDLKYIIFENIENTGLVRHLFTTRKGGVSEGAFSSLNLSWARGDTNENVLKNFDLACSAVGMDYKNCVIARMAHSANVYAATAEDRGKGITRNTDITDTDGLMTNEKGLVLVAGYADCVPLVFLDPEKRAIAIAHAGWRGTVNGIAKNTVKKMNEVYGSNPKDILAGIGPAIGLCCFEVDEPVANEFYEKLPFAEDYVTKDRKKDKYMIDLQGVNSSFMIEAGVKAENIEIARMCTKCMPELFFSHRGMGDVHGSMGGFIELI